MIGTIIGIYLACSYILCMSHLFKVFSFESTVGERVFYGVAWLLSPVAVWLLIIDILES